MKQSFLILFIFSVAIFNSCKKKDSLDDSGANTVNLPTLTTTTASAITQTSAQSGGNISSNGGGTITAKGLCWSTVQFPTTANNISSNGVSNEFSFSGNITGLTANTTYFARAYATNSAGTGYGNQISFTTLQANTISDFDGNIYQTITIGTQTWTIENLKTTHYANGDAVVNTTDNTQWSTLSSGSYCSYSNTSSNISIYGLLYNWHAVNDSRKLTPAGWRIPTDTDWQILADYLGGNNVAGDKMKETGTTHWVTGNTGTNTSGFTALPGGYRTNTGSFGDIGNQAGFWSTSSINPTNSWSRGLTSYAPYISRNNSAKTSGYSIRLVKD